MIEQEDQLREEIQRKLYEIDNLNEYITRLVGKHAHKINELNNEMIKLKMKLKESELELRFKIANARHELR